MLTKLGESKPSEVIEKLRQEASFSSELLLTIVVRISLPAKNGHSQLEARIKRMSVDWPTITSLGTTQLYIPNRRPDRGDRKLLQVPIRYNPGSSSPGWPSMRSRSASISDKGRLEEEEVPSDKGRLEWELKSLPFHQPSEGGDAGGAGVSISESDVMMLHIGHPGELFKKEKLEVNAEVEIRATCCPGWKHGCSTRPDVSKARNRNSPRASGSAQTCTQRTCSQGARFHRTSSLSSMTSPRTKCA